MDSSSSALSLKGAFERAAFELLEQPFLLNELAQSVGIEQISVRYSDPDGGIFIAVYCYEGLRFEGSASSKKMAKACARAELVIHCLQRKPELWQERGCEDSTALLRTYLAMYDNCLDMVRCFLQSNSISMELDRVFPNQGKNYEVRLFGHAFEFDTLNELLSGLGKTALRSLRKFQPPSSPSAPSGLDSYDKSAFDQTQSQTSMSWLRDTQVGSLGQAWKGYGRLATPYEKREAVDNEIVTSAKVQIIFAAAFCGERYTFSDFMCALASGNFIRQLRIFGGMVCHETLDVKFLRSLVGLRVREVREKLCEEVMSSKDA
jgi:hypothetical protein